MNNILVTGAAGFIGFHIVKRLLEDDCMVFGIDNLNTYYDVDLKLDRLRALGIDIKDKSCITKKQIKGSQFEKFTFKQIDIADQVKLNRLFHSKKFDIVINLAAQAGVRYSITNPNDYIQSNIVGFFNVLEACRQNQIKHLIYASSSSVYGNNDTFPFKELEKIDQPLSLYAATKSSNELMAHSYSHLYKLHTTGLRFFTVYGPWGRPDMAPFIFTKAIMEGKPIKVFNNGNLQRDFTYIEDIIDGIVAVTKKPCQPGDYKIFNIGNNKPENLLYFIEVIEKHTHKKALKELLPMQAGDIYKTCADISLLHEWCGYKPKVSLDKGMGKFIEWYNQYYSL